MSDESSGLIPVTDHELFQATTSRGFEPGQVIFGRFVLTRVLGRGGMGIVWLAHDTQLEQDIAIKVLPDVVMHDREAVTDMKRETKRSLQLNHHNIVRIYDFNQDENGAGISMEFVDGETLSSAKAERPNGCFDVEEVGPWLEQICEALAYAHNTAKIVHRDLKPANIMLSKTNTIKVTDFGIARSISESISRVSMRHASSGTMVYMSPQQSNGARSTSSDDIYALGATIYDLLTGKPPFFSGNIQNQLENITPPTMAARREELDRPGSPIPEVWERVVASCLEKEPGRRPASVMELAQQLGLRTTSFATAPPTPSIPLPAAAPAYERTITESPLGLPQAPGLVPPTSYGTVAHSPAAPEPAPSWFTPARLQMVYAGGGVLVAAVVIAGLISFFSRGTGSVSLATTPPGAAITIGDKSGTSPATVEAIPSGNTTVSITLDGYDPVQMPVKVNKNDTTQLGMTNLRRSTGSIAVSVLPKDATCTLKLVSSPVAEEPSTIVASFPGTAPWQSPVLNTGKYALITNASGFPQREDDFEIKRGDAQHLQVDLVKDDSITGLNPDEVSAVNSDQPIPAKLAGDTTAKTALTDYYQKTFEGYLKIDEFDLAEGQMKKLSTGLGDPTADDQKELDLARLVFEKGQGTLSVKTDPAGASVSVDGQTLVSPAIFNKLIAGTKTIDVKLDGFDPVQVPGQVTRDILNTLDPIKLTRSTGQVQIIAIPRHAACTFNLVHTPVAMESPTTVATFSGPEAWSSGALNTGSYAVTATADGLAPTTKNIEIKAGDNLNVTVDLVKENAEHSLSPDQVTVVESDQPIPDAIKQNDAAKTAVTNYYQQTFESYLQLQEFKLAENQLHHLTGDLGVTSPADQQQLDQLQAAWIATEKTNLNQLIQQEKFTEADALLADMEAHGPQPDLRAALDQAKTAHEATVTKALGDIDALTAAGKTDDAYKAAVAAQTADKLEPRLAMRVANLELPMPSSYDRVENRVKAMSDLQKTDPALAQDTDFVRVLGIFQKNLDRHNEFHEQIAEAKRATGGFDSRIADLRAQEKHNQDKANGYKALAILGIAGGIAGAAYNSAPGAVAGVGTGMVGANGATARENDVHAIQAQIADLQQEEAARVNALDDLRQKYAAFSENPINAIQ